MNKTLIILYTGAILAASAIAQERGGRGAFMRFNPLLAVLDADHDGKLSAEEIKNAPAALLSLDKNGDGQLTQDELRPAMRPGMEGGRGPEREGPPQADSLVTTLMAFDRNGDGRLSKEELPDRMQGMFDRGDTNKDGVLDKQEIEKMAAAQTARQGGGPGGPGRPGGFARMDPVTAAIDTDHDGILSSTEIARASASLAKLDRNGDGQLTEDELRPNFGPGGMPRDPSQMVERMFQEFDRNGDGKLAKSEVPGRLQEMFDSADADKDGFLSRDELKKAIEQGGMFPGGPGPGRMRREGGRPE